MKAKAPDPDLVPQAQDLVQDPRVLSQAAQGRAQENLLKVPKEEGKRGGKVKVDQGRDRKGKIFWVC